MTSTGTWDSSKRLPALRRFAVAITILTVVGHLYLGFEQSLAQPLVALATAYSMELLLEALEAWSQRRRPQFTEGWSALVHCLLPAHITGLACAMLMYGHDRLLPFAFAAAVGIASKFLFRISVGNGRRHFLNPSNTGIAVTLLLFPWVGISQPYQFTENTAEVGDWLVPGIIVCTGTFLNWRFTGKLPLILGWLAGFVAQAGLRSLVFDTPFVAALLPMTGMSFLLFTFYMVTDPATTPTVHRRQVLFGMAVAATYGMLQVSHVVFGLFFALAAVCTVRGFCLSLATVLQTRPATVLQPAHNRFALAEAEPVLADVDERDLVAASPPSHRP